MQIEAVETGSNPTVFVTCWVLRMRLERLKSTRQRTLL